MGAVTQDLTYAHTLAREKLQTKELLTNGRA